VKYLKRYKLFEFYGIDIPKDMQELGTHIDEILSDLTDDGFRVDNNLYHSPSHDQIFIYIYDVPVSELRDPITHLLEYMKEEYFEIQSIHFHYGEPDYVKGSPLHIQLIDKDKVLEWLEKDIIVSKIELRFVSSEL
jgi:hypothetical protein